MDWVQVVMLIISIFATFFGNLGMILWFRSESRSDWRQMDAEFKEFRQIWMEESKEFHKRLLEIEMIKPKNAG